MTAKYIASLEKKDELEKEVMLLRSEVQSLKQQIAALLVSNDGLVVSNNSLLVSNNSLLVSNESLKTEIATLEAEVKDLKTENAKRNREENYGHAVLLKGSIAFNIAARIGAFVFGEKKWKKMRSYTHTIDDIREEDKDVDEVKRWQKFEESWDYSLEEVMKEWTQARNSFGHPTRLRPLEDNTEAPTPDELIEYITKWAPGKDRKAQTQNLKDLVSRLDGLRMGGPLLQ